MVSVLTDEQHQFIERVGLYFEQYHLSRIGGRLLGLLLLAEHPLGLPEMAKLLGVSQASISTNIRMTTEFGMTERVSFPGNRRTFYRACRGLGGQTANTKIVGAQQLRQIAATGLAVISEEMTLAHENLTELVEFCDFIIADYQGMVARWEAYREEQRRQPLLDDTT